MEKKDEKQEVAKQPAEQAQQPENNMNNEAVMQMMKHFWPDTNDQKEKENLRNLHKELIYHYEYQLVAEKKLSATQDALGIDYDEVFSKALIYARCAMNEIQAYERGDYKRMFEQNQPNTNN